MDEVEEAHIHYILSLTFVYSERHGGIDPREDRDPAHYWLMCALHEALAAGVKGLPSLSLAAQVSYFILFREVPYSRFRGQTAVTMDHCLGPGRLTWHSDHWLAYCGLSLPLMNRQVTDLSVT